MRAVCARLPLARFTQRPLSDRVAPRAQCRGPKAAPRRLQAMALSFTTRGSPRLDSLEALRDLPTRRAQHPQFFCLTPSQLMAMVLSARAGTHWAGSGVATPCKTAMSLPVQSPMRSNTQRHAAGSGGLLAPTRVITEPPYEMLEPVLTSRSLLSIRNESEPEPRERPAGRSSQRPVIAFPSIAPMNTLVTTETREKTKKLRLRHS